MTATPGSTSSRSSSGPSTPQRAAAPSAWPLSWRCAAHCSARACGAAWWSWAGSTWAARIDPLHNAIDVVELAVEKGASVILMPVSARKQLFDLSDDMATKVNILFYSEAREALIKAIAD